MLFQKVSKKIKNAPYVVFKVSFSSLLNLQAAKIIKDIQKHGYSVLTMQDSSQQTLSEVSSCFGNIQHNNNTNALGIAEIIGENSKMEKISSAVVSNLKFNAHTDGAYLHGISQIGNDIYRKSSPPKLVLLQCVKAASVGGNNYLIDGKVVLEALLSNDPWIFKTLSKPQSMSISHRDHMATDLPVFATINDQYLIIRYSYDKSLFFPEWAQMAHEVFNKKYLENPAFVSYLRLKPNQCLVVDNRRMLHGREAFEGSRHFRRTWIHDEELSPIMLNASIKNEDNYSSKKNFTPAFSRFDKYGIATDHIKSSSSLMSMPLGIPLPTKSAKASNKVA